MELEEIVKRIKAAKYDEQIADILYLPAEYVPRYSVTALDTLTEELEKELKARKEGRYKEGYEDYEGW